MTQKLSKPEKIALCGQVIGGCGVVVMIGEHLFGIQPIIGVVIIMLCPIMGMYSVFIDKGPPE